MKLNFKEELKVWSVYILTIFLSIFIHEIGHCIPVWVEGYQAIPTPAKEYIMDEIPEQLEFYSSFGGIVGTLLATAFLMFLYLTRSYSYSSTLLAGGLAVPGVYALRFFLIGRGHDGTEFQEAQSVFGFSYSGHSLDWIFFIVVLSGLAMWILKSRPGFRIIGRIVLGVVVTVIFLIVLQEINNAIFDPLFQPQN